MAALLPVHILLVDDFELFRGLIVSMLRDYPRFQVVAEAGNEVDAVKKAEELKPDLALLDVDLPGENGLTAARRISAVSPNTKVLLVSANASRGVVRKALTMGILGCVIKSRLVQDLVPAMEVVLKGKTFVSRVLAINEDRVHCQEQ
jgi:DNA-binding NarL/FixJ family response regulator